MDAAQSGSDTVVSRYDNGVNPGFWHGLSNKTGWMAHKNTGGLISTQANVNHPGGQSLVSITATFVAGSGLQSFGSHTSNWMFNNFSAGTSQQAITSFTQNLLIGAQSGGTPLNFVGKIYDVRLREYKVAAYGSQTLVNLDGIRDNLIYYSLCSSSSSSSSSLSSSSLSSSSESI